MSTKHNEVEEASSRNNNDKSVSKFVEPKLTFHKPELEKQGSLENLTKQGFFGVFPGQGS